MRVVHLLRKCDPAEWGGTETALQRLFQGLSAHDVAPIVYCPRLEHDAEADPLQSAGCQVQRFRTLLPVWGLSRQRRRQLIAQGGNLMSFDLLPALWRERDISLIHTHTLGRIGGIALTVAKRRQLPFVVTIHGGVLDLPDTLKRSFHSPASDGWEWGRVFGLLFQSRNLFRDASVIITCNENEATLLRREYPNKRIAVQPHAVPIEPFQRDQRPAAREAFPRLAGRDVLLSLGRIDPIKNQGWLIEQTPALLRRHPRALLVLAGACTDPPYGKRLREKVHLLGLDQAMLWTGALPPNDPRLIGLLQEARVLLLPSVSETFGLVILEAWAAGVPVLSSRTSGATALIEPGRNGWLFDPQEPPTFHTALDEILAEPDRARQCAAFGTEQVRRHYTIAALGGRMKALYEQAIEDNRCTTSSCATTTRTR